MPKEVQQNYFMQMATNLSANALKKARLSQAYKKAWHPTEPEIKDSKEKVKEAIAEMLAYRSTGHNSPYMNYDPKIDGGGELPKNIKDHIEKEKRGFLSDANFNNMIDSCTPDELLNLVGKQKLNEKNELDWIPAQPQQVVERLSVTREKANQNRHRLNELIDKLDQSTHKSFTGKLKSWFVGNSDEYKKAYKAMQGIVNGTITHEQAKKDITAYLNLRGKKVRNHQYGKDRFDAFMSGLSTIMKPAEFRDFCHTIDVERYSIDNSYKIGTTKADNYKTPEQKLSDIDLENDEKRMNNAMKSKATQEKQRTEDHNQLAQLVQYGIRKQFGTKNGVVDKTVGNTLTEERKQEMEYYLQNNPSAREAAKQIIDQFDLGIKVPPIREVPGELKQRWQLGDKQVPRPGSPEDPVMKNAENKFKERDAGGLQL